MGAYLSYLTEPVTEKVSCDEGNDKLKYGASSMQGWRVTQEDAHNCLLDFDTNICLFAVYDGHGGSEVAQYCSQNLPQFIKDTQAYKDGDIENALIEGFLGFDGTIATTKVIDILKKLAGKKDTDDESEDENVDKLYEEATMPIEQVIEKYTNFDSTDSTIDNLKKFENDKSSKSSCSNTKNEDESSIATSSSDGGECGIVNLSEGNNTDGVSSSSNYINEAKVIEADASNSCVTAASSSESPCKEAIAITPNNEVEKSKEIVPDFTHNGEVCESEMKDDVTSSSVPQNNGEVAYKGKGKALAKTPIKKKENTARLKRFSKEIYKSLLDYGYNSEDDTEDEEDKTFEEPNDASSDDEEEEGVNVAIEAGSEESSVEEEEEAGEEEEDLDEEDEEEGFYKNMKEEPGSDSGCTAVVAILKGNNIYVANAGDSRCIVCRNGKAVEMSFDHKPEDELERERIVKAGGEVTFEGRVNGRLNLSRAIGDHAYKQNKNLSDKEQMITALPDIKTLSINPGEDEFMVLACDGIWNFMSSQDVVDFVKPRIDTCEKLSQICEEMFDHCLAPDIMGDGTGCDNMTCIIVEFKSNTLKRAASPLPDQATAKRGKTEENDQQIDTTV